MSRFVPLLAAVLFFAAAVSAQAQVVETTPSAPVRTEEAVTITFHADRGSQGLKDCNCDVWAHTGLNTGAGTWRYVMDEWPNNRLKTKLTKVAENTYELTIPDIRAYYSDNNTGYGEVPPKSQEEIEQLAFVFRNADGTKEGKTVGGGDIFVDVTDVEAGPHLSITLQRPEAASPLNPFIAATDTTVDVSVSAETSNVDRFEKLRLLVDDQTVETTSSTSLTHPLSLTDPGRVQIRAEAEARANDSTLTDVVATALIRSPDVVDQPRPPGVQDGINYNSDGSVTLSLFAPKKEFAYVIGDFTNWEIDNRYFLKREKTPNGAHWWGTVENIDPQVQYDFQYLVDGKVRVPDPFSHKLRTPVDDRISEAVYPGLQPYPGDKTDGLVSVIRPSAQQDAFPFSDFDPPAQEDLVIYELLLRDFVEESSFDVLTDTLDYLDRLGVNAVELLPVTNFEGHNFWGYRPNAHLAMDKSYGPPEGLKRFVEEAHNRGIAVLLDMVYNHITANSAISRLYETADENPFLESGPNRGICGVFFRELNQGSPFIKRYINRVNRYWIKEFNVDGFRFDVAHCVADDGVNINDVGHDAALRSGWKALADSVWSVNPDAYVTLEMFGAAGVANELGGYGGVGNTGGVLNWHKMSGPYSRADMAKLDGGSNLSTSYFENRPDDQPSGVTYMTSHDEQWLMRRKKAIGNGNSTYSTQDVETALDRQKLVGAFFFTVPGPRLMWQFGEVGYGWGPDECLKGFRSGDVCPASAPRRIGSKPVRWDYVDPDRSPERVDLYETWKALIRLRNDHDVFSRARTGSEEAIAMNVANGETVRCIRLEDGGLDATVIGNFGVTVQTMTVESGGNEGACSFSQTGTWHNFFEDDTLEVNGARSVQLRPGEFRIYTSEPQPAPPMGLVPSAPVYRTRTSVSSNGTVDFGATGVDISFSGVSDDGTVTVEKLDEPPLDNSDVDESNVSAYRFVIESTGGLSFDDQTEVRFDVSTLDGVNDANNVTIYSRSTEDTGSFSSLNTQYDSGADELYVTTDSFSEFVLASDTEPLPVELAGFEATLTGERTVRLSWRTAGETNNAGFQVQRRASGDATAEQEAGWSDVTFVEGAGTTDETQTYRVTDEASFAADSVQYRLKQVDVDGSTSVMEAITVGVGASDQLTLRPPFPNPVQGQATVRYAVPSRQKVSLVLFDVLGREVRTVTRSPQEGRHELQLDVSGLASGAYILRLKGADRIETQQITVVK